MPKVAYFIDSHDPGGAESMVVELCKNAHLFGYSPEIYHFGNTWLEEKCLEYNIPSKHVPGYRLYKSPLTIPIFSLIFYRFLQRRHIDILHSHLFGPVTSACFAASLAKIPHIGTLHDIYTIEEKKSRIRYITLSTSLGTRLIAVSEQMKQYINAMGKYPDGTVQTIVNGVDLEKYSCVESIKGRPELHLNQDDIVFICVGRLEKIKGHADLIKAFSQLDSLVNVRLLIVGEGPHRQEITRLIDELGLNDHVRLLGQREDIPRLLQLADCFVLSSYSEGLSCSIIEAMATGLPVLATDVGGNCELVQNGVNGYIVPPHAPQILATRMNILIADARIRKKYGKMSLLRAQEKYSIQIMMRKYTDIYAEMIMKKSGTM